MRHNQWSDKLTYIYLCIVPLITIVLAFTVGHVTPYIFVPAWIAHTIWMLYATWRVGLKYVDRTNEQSVRLAVAGALFVVPWILATIFAGMGPPPFKIRGWAELAEEQRFRFGILVVCGLSLAAAFSLMYESAKQRGEVVYSRLSLAGVLIATPIFIVVMAFWGTSFPETAIMISKTSPQTLPDWLAPWRHMIEFLTTIEVCLFYISTAMLAISMNRLNWLPARVCNIYCGLSLLAVAASLLPESVPEPLMILNYLAGIPAIMMAMPYLLGLRLLWHIDTLR